MKKLAIDLTEKEQQEFCERFYQCSDVDEDDDSASPCPWGCPWIWSDTKELVGKDLDQMAENYWLEIRDEWFELTQFPIDFNYNKRVHGSVQFETTKGSIEVVIFQQPYINDILGQENEYTSTGLDENKNKYTIRWPITNFDCDDESEACDWDNNYKIEKQG